MKVSFIGYSLNFSFTQDYSAHKLFLIHSIQLGFSWLLIGITILILLSKLTGTYKYHHTTSWSIIGFFVVKFGLAIIWFSEAWLGKDDEDQAICRT